MMRLQLTSDGVPAAPGAAAASRRPPLDPASFTLEDRSPYSESNDLMGNSLASYFSQLFDKPPNEPADKGKEKKKFRKYKKTAKDKKKVEPLPEFQPTLPEVSVPRTPSPFAVFAAIRATCLEDRLRQSALLQLQSAAAWKNVEDGEGTDLSPDESSRKEVVLPKIVSIGLMGVFEIIREARSEFPAICKKALESLLNILQGLQPEELMKEPNSVTDPMYQTLLDLASVDDSPSVSSDSGQHVRALACACLLSFSVALGDTGKLLRACAKMLMSPKGSDQIIMPYILVNLQRSVVSVMLGNVDHPNVMTQGVPTNSNLDEFDVKFQKGSSPKHVYSMTSNGAYLFLQTSHGLFKVGSGYSGTIKGKIYKHQPNFNSDPGWLGYAQGYIYFKPYPMQQSSIEVHRVDSDTLVMQDLLPLRDDQVCNVGELDTPYHMLSDGQTLGILIATNKEEFKIKVLNIGTNGLSYGSEMPLKLARKCVSSFGSSVFHEGDKCQNIEFGNEEDVVDIKSGKEIAFMRSKQGKMYFAGKSGCIGQKQSSLTAKWAEISLSRSPKLTDMAIGHEGQHALLLSDEGSVYFTGIARRGEDGDQTKNRRQPKPVKPKRFSKVEGINILQVACNNGSSAMVSKEGELFIFGKDSSHGDSTSGVVTDLKGVCVIQVALGKAHIIALAKNGDVYSFGMNNKGQCGRDFPGNKDDPTTDGVSITDKNADDTFNSDNESEQSGVFSICAKDRHNWKHEQCMVCVVCGECTGYGSSCISSGRPDRNPGMLCGCGSGDSGCGDCGICHTCAGEESDFGASPLDLASEENPLGGIAADRASSLRQSLQELRAKHRARLLASQERKNYKQKQLIRRSIQKMRNGSRSRRLTDCDDSRRSIGDGAADGPGVKPELKNRDKHYMLAASGSQAGTSDVEKEAGKLSSLPPAKVSLPRDVKITNIACGLHHTLLLSSKGEVFVFGSNSHGQLGLFDLVPRGAPINLALPFKAVAIAAGSYHSVILSSKGEVYTFGSYQKGQLGRDVGESILQGAASAEEMADKELWFAKPKPIPKIGPKYGRTATWVGASSDQTFIKIDESLINAKSLKASCVTSNKRHIVLMPSATECSNFMCLSISREDGFCKSFRGQEQEEFSNKILHADAIFNVLWSYDCQAKRIKSHLPPMSDFRKRNKESMPTILSPELALPNEAGCLVSRNQASLNLLSCLDTLNQMPEVNLAGLDEDISKVSSNKTFTKEDFLVVNRFDSHGGGWGYSGHSIEAIRFMADTDILIGGFGLFGGRGEYVGKIKLFDIGSDGGDQESDGELMAESEEITYECGARQKYPILFDEPVPIQASRWYIAWARVSGPSSDCGSSGQTQVLTEDQIQFFFKSSKKSNNGTDVNAGQVPQLLYKIVAQENQSKAQANDSSEPICILSKKFSRTVTADCFHSLLSLIGWSWNAFRAGLWNVLEVEDEDPGSQAVLLDLERFIYIVRACLRLLVIYIHEVYPNKISPNQPRPVCETQKLAETVYETRNLLQQILRDPLLTLHKAEQNSPRSMAIIASCKKMSSVFLSDTHRTFVVCFHAFYPTGYLKWACLCNLLASMESGGADSGFAYNRLLSAVLDSLCQPMIKLRNTFPITYSPETETRCKNLSPTENLSITTSMIQAGDNSSHRYPILTELMNYQSHLDGVKFASWSFREVLDRLLAIVSQPVKQALRGEQIFYSQDLEEKACHVIAAVISELANQSIAGDTDIQTLGGRILHITPNRFMRTSNSRTWNTGNGSPDAICFSVDKPGIFVVGCTVYGGMGTYDYELELLDTQSSGEKDPNRQSQRWNSLEIAHGNYSSDDCVGDIAEIKFEKPVMIKPFVKYALRLRNHGGRTSNGDGGISVTKGPDGTTFTFSSCSLSFNGTNPTRGQLPQLLYFSSPQENDVQSSTKSIAELYSKRTALSMTSTIVKTVSNLLVNARDSLEEKALEILNHAPIITKMMPHVLASISNLTKQDPHSSVQIVSFIQDLLPSVTFLNNLDVMGEEKSDTDDCKSETESDEGLPSPHYAWVESEHPYKPANVSNHRVTFPASVHWMSIEFDARSATAQMEDILQIYIRTPVRNRNTESANRPIISATSGSTVQPKQEKYIPVLKKLSGNSNWPQHAIILPGNEVLFSLETASDYIKDEKTSNWGFKCLVVGYEAVYQRDQGLKNLEMELSYLGGLCSSSLMKRDLPLSCTDDTENDAENAEEAAKQIFEAHSVLLSKGFALEHAPTVHMALDGLVPFNFKSNEMTFLRNFVNCTQETSGGRLAKWLQPESFVNVDKCKVLFCEEEMRCNWPTVITIITQDQYREVVQVPNMRVEVKAVPVDDMNKSGSKLRKATEPDAMTFGGHRPPNLEAKYEVTVKDKMFYHAITVHKQYDNYSFEELRFASPALQRQSENMLVRANNDGTYSANWTPGNIGGYRIHVSVDGTDMTESFKVLVKDPPQGVAPPPNGSSKRTCGQDNIHRLRKFIAKPSKGLRIRIHPTLQSEQIGIIPVDGIVSIVDEIHNSDGIWVRLGQETMSDAAPNHSEGWCLQYNQHLEKTLMIPVTESKNSKEISKNQDFIAESSLPGAEVFNPEPFVRSVQHSTHCIKKYFPTELGKYKVVKCGASGHNIRSNPNLSAAPIGVINLNDAINVIGIKTEFGETWVQLDQESIEKHCFSFDGDAWSLAVSSTDIHYLQSEVVIEEDRLGLQHFLSQSMIPLSDDGSYASLPIQGSSTIPKPRPRIESLSRRKSESMRKSPVHLDMASYHDPAPGRERKPTPSPRHSLRRESSPLSASSDGKKPSFFSKLFKSEGTRRGASASPPTSRKSSAAMFVNKDIPPELQGVSVKELVKVIGESRANGNGVTPPDTPNSVRKASCRSLSPKVSRSASSSPVSFRVSSLPLAANGSKSQGSGGEAAAIQRLNFSQSDSMGGLVPDSAREQPSQCPANAGFGLLSGKSERASSRSPQARRKRETDEKDENSSTAGMVDPEVSLVGGTIPKSPSHQQQQLQHPSQFVSISDSITRQQQHSRNLSTPVKSSGSHKKQSSSSSRATSVAATMKQIGGNLVAKNASFMQNKSASTNKPVSSRSYTTMRQQHSVEFVTPKGSVKEAMSPSLAESIRSVFAAFIWHEGIVHDAMAVASYLKFHPNMSKKGGLTSEPISEEGLTKINKENDETSKLEMLRKQRHSVEVISQQYLKSKVQLLDSQVLEGKVTGNANTNRNLAKQQQMQDLIPKEESLMLQQSLQRIKDSNLPPTMKFLGMLWEKIHSYCRHAILQQVILNSPIYSSSAAAISGKKVVGAETTNRRDKERKVKKMKRKVSSNERRGDPLWATVVPSAASSSNNMDSAKTAVSEKEAFFQLCDICGNYFQHPVTYHMRLAHPGCGMPAGGKGYNSGGNYCGGWAGNCGDGGAGGSSWYLICEKCRKDYTEKAILLLSPPSLSGKDEKISSEGSSKLKPLSLLSTSSMRLASPSNQVNSHNVMNSNAMFLLDLASSSNCNLYLRPRESSSSSSPYIGGESYGSSPSSLSLDRQQTEQIKSLGHNLSELSQLDPNPFPMVPFQCLSALGVQAKFLKLLNDELVLDEALKRGGSGEGLFQQDNISPPAQFKGQLRDIEGNISQTQEKQSFQPEKVTEHNDEIISTKKPFCRSISVGCSPAATSSSQWAQSERIEEQAISEEISKPDIVSATESRNPRKRNSSLENGSPDTLASISDGYKKSHHYSQTAHDFLSNPSKALQKLFDDPMSSSTTDILQRPVMNFVLQWNDLESLQVSMTMALRKASCRTFAMQALNWLLRSVSQPACLHDLLWFFVSAMESSPNSPNAKGIFDEKDKKNKKNSSAELQQDLEKEKEPPTQQTFGLCDHPTSDIFVAGEAVKPLPETFHSLLQTISDLMLLLPVGSALQQVAIRCWGIKFKSSDHHFLHQSHVFSTISQILSRSDELDNLITGGAAANNTQANASLCEMEGSVVMIKDITEETEIKVSSRPAMSNSLNDNSTETFWESGDEDRNKTKWVSIQIPSGASHFFSNVSVHLDNGRDLGNKVSSVTFKGGQTLEDVQLYKQIDVESRFAGWLSCFIEDHSHKVVKIELRGPDNTLRLRQVKALGGSYSSVASGSSNVLNASTSQKNGHDVCSIQQRNCETETLRVFRLITGQVFGRLLEESHLENEDANEAYFKEHVVGILFSRSNLTHLQKQVCSHIVLAIQKESSRFRDDWEVSLCSGEALSPEELPQTSDTYCFEMLSLVMALSGSTVGRHYLAQQLGLIRDLLALLHTGSSRIQRQVIALMRRVLPKIPPQHLANILGIHNLPPKEFGILSTSATKESEESNEEKSKIDVFKPGILDIFLGCIAKALTLQVKSKQLQKHDGPGSRNITTTSLATSIHPRDNLGDRWWLRGSMSKKLAEEIINLLKDLTSGKLGEEWSVITKSAIAENILHLTRLEDYQRKAEECLRHPVIWLALASLCVLDKDHVQSLSSGDWSNVAGGEGSPPRPTCENHDDNETPAIILCDQCGNLCGDCDRFLHLNRRTRDHQRQIFKEEEDAIKVDLHEGCGRTKLFWLMALADSLTLKAMVEFKENNGRNTMGVTSKYNLSYQGNITVCRFCGTHTSADMLVMDSVCTDKECVEMSRLACTKHLPCGHFCGGISGESQCMPCLHGCSGASLKQDADDMCMICFTEALSPVPSLWLECGHVFHYKCCAKILEKKWIGPRITFGFRNCPICKAKIVHEALRKYLDPIDALYEDVKKKSLMRLEYEGLSKCEAVTSKGARYYNNLAGFALNRYAYYVCFKCQKAYYGGEAQCDADVGLADEYNPEELVCGGCSDVSRAQMCPKHGTDYLEYKCRYCCSTAVFFCFGTTHFCNACHDDFHRVANLPKQELPQCPVGPKCVQLEGDECPLHVKHPPTGEEFALGCGVCRNAHTF